MEEDETASYDLADYHGSIEGVCFQEDKVWHRRNDSMTEKDVMEAARRLAGIIRETDIYKEYLQCR